MARTQNTPADDDMIDLTPEGPVDFSSGDGEVDLDALQLNFSDAELGSEARGVDTLPTGEYPVFIHKCDVLTSKSEKNFGKPYYALGLRVSGGKYDGRFLFTNVMLFDGALYSYSQLAKALGRNPKGPLLKPSDLIAQQVVAVAQKVVDKYKIKNGEWDEASGEPKPMKTEVRGFKKFALAGSGGASDPLMP